MRSLLSQLPRIHLGMDVVHNVVEVAERCGFTKDVPIQVLTDDRGWEDVTQHHVDKKWLDGHFRKFAACNRESHGFPYLMSMDQRHRDIIITVIAQYKRWLTDSIWNDCFEHTTGWNSTPAFITELYQYKKMLDKGDVDVLLHEYRVSGFADRNVCAWFRDNLFALVEDSHRVANLVGALGMDVFFMLKEACVKLWHLLKRKCMASTAFRALTNICRVFKTVETELAKSAADRGSASMQAQSASSSNNAENAKTVKTAPVELQRGAPKNGKAPMPRDAELQRGASKNGKAPMPRDAAVPLGGRRAGMLNQKVTSRVSHDPSAASASSSALPSSAARYKLKRKPTEASVQTRYPIVPYMPRDDLASMSAPPGSSFPKMPNQPPPSSPEPPPVQTPSVQTPAPASTKVHTMAELAEAQTVTYSDTDSEDLSVCETSTGELNDTTCQVLREECESLHRDVASMAHDTSLTRQERVQKINKVAKRAVDLIARRYKLTLKYVHRPSTLFVNKKFRKYDGVVRMKNSEFHWKARSVDVADAWISVFDRSYWVSSHEAALARAIFSVPASVPSPSSVEVSESIQTRDSHMAPMSTDPDFSTNDEWTGRIVRLGTTDGNDIVSFDNKCAVDKFFGVVIGHTINDANGERIWCVVAFGLCPIEFLRLDLNKEEMKVALSGFTYVLKDHYDNLRVWTRPLSKVGNSGSSSDRYVSRNTHFAIQPLTEELLTSELFSRIVMSHNDYGKKGTDTIEYYTKGDYCVFKGFLSEDEGVLSEQTELIKRRLDEFKGSGHENHSGYRSPNSSPVHSAKRRKMSADAGSSSAIVEVPTDLAAPACVEAPACDEAPARKSRADILLEICMLKQASADELAAKSAELFQV